MKRYLLDTNILSDLIRNPHGQVFENIQRVGEQNVHTSIIVSGELRYGAQKKGSPKLMAKVESLLNELSVLPLEAPADAAYGHHRAVLERAGTMIGANDLMIACQARALGLIMVTHNVDEFSRIEGLTIENWLSK